MRSRFFSVALTPIVLLTGCVSAQPDAVDQAKWCGRGPSHQIEASDEIPEGKVYAVPALKQASAIARLKNKGTAVLSRSAAEAMLGRKLDVEPGHVLVLSRSALYGGDDQYNLPRPAFRASPFTVYFRVSENFLHVSSATLGGDKNERKVALIIVLPKAPSSMHVNCMTAY